ncbi:IS200/IS605 family transposase [Aphanothece hegewaldii CCALA 016]|uniref:IS200/IS605 family transposase n=1 Tax=Aphanothece hegewaldii CCALA 016 TaxID=2107694 RepID=A0A2T1LTM6_9CHRO|nr:IS200/IS605 family transposase [Aphanothece hegewaldii CCALA 016]
MALWRLYYHLVWATKNRYPYLTSEKEKKLYPYIIGKADSLNTIIHAIGGIEDHIHLVASIPPSISITDFVKNLKGSSSHYLKTKLINSPKFFWQEGYGIFSLGRKQLDQAVNYVINQKTHYQQKTIITSLETTSFENNPPSREYLISQSENYES